MQNTYFGGQKPPKGAKVVVGLMGFEVFLLVFGSWLIFRVYKEMKAFENGYGLDGVRGQRIGGGYEAVGRRDEEAGGFRPFQGAGTRIG